MDKPSDTVVESVEPSHNIDELPITDGYSLRRVAHAELHDSLRIPRGGPHDATLIALRKSYDGTSGGIPGIYVLLYVEFRTAHGRWRTAGTKVRAEEAARVARDMSKGKASKPAKNEPSRVGGKEVETGESTLMGAPVDGGYCLFIRSRMRTGAWGRTRGVTILAAEIPIMVLQLQGLAAALKSKS